MIPDDDYSEGMMREEAVPAWAPLKERILTEYFRSKEFLSKYRMKRNPRYFADFLCSMVTLWDLTKEYYESDDRFPEQFPTLKELDAYLFKPLTENTHGDTWWYSRYRELDGMLYQLGIIRITRSKSEDDLAGWER